MTTAPNDQAIAPDADPQRVPEHPAAADAAVDAAAPAARDAADLEKPVLQRLTLADPLRWIALGWRDFRRAPGIGLFFGIVFVVMGWALRWVFREAPAYTLALSAGFLLMGPFLCLGMYRTSQRLEAGQKPDLGDSLTAWDTRTGQLAIFGFVLLVLEMLWGRATLVVFAVTFDGMPDFQGSLLALLNPQNIEFILAWTAVGAIFAGLIYSVSVIAMPMILDRQTDAITAGLTSMRLVLTQPVVMIWWGALITAVIVLAMLPWFLGLVIAGPLVGHASWHAYRAAVRWQSVAPQGAANSGPG